MQPNGTFPVDDIIDVILNLLPDFRSLHSCILVSTAFYRVFARHPKSILHTVATNKIGPIDAALDFLLFQAPEYSFPERRSGDPVLKFPVRPFLVVPQVIQKYESSTLPWNEMKLRQSLDALGTRVDQWEADFYLRRQEVIGGAEYSPLESFRFRRACCRLVLFGKAYDYAFAARQLIAKSYILPSPSEMRQMFEAKVNFLDQLSTEELREMRVVAKYMSQILKAPVDLIFPEERLFEVPVRLFVEIQPRCFPPCHLLDFQPGPIFQTTLVKEYFFSPLDAVLTKRGSLVRFLDHKFWDYLSD